MTDQELAQRCNGAEPGKYTKQNNRKAWVAASIALGFVMFAVDFVRWFIGLFK